MSFASVQTHRRTVRRCNTLRFPAAGPTSPRCNQQSLNETVEENFHGAMERSIKTSSRSAMSSRDVDQRVGDSNARNTSTGNNLQSTWRGSVNYNLAFGKLFDEPATFFVRLMQHCVQSTKRRLGGRRLIMPSSADGISGKPSATCL